jgi:hypothetical protein
MKNRDLIISNLRESIYSLKMIIRGLETGVVFGSRTPLTYKVGNFRVDLEQAYRHMNFAWHIRNVSHARAVMCSDADHEAWSKFPFDVESH